MKLDCQFTNISNPKTGGWGFALLPSINIGFDHEDLVYYIEFCWMTFDFEITLDANA